MSIDCTKKKITYRNGELPDDSKSDDFSDFESAPIIIAALCTPVKMTILDPQSPLWEISETKL